MSCSWYSDHHIKPHESIQFKEEKKKKKRKKHKQCRRETFLTTSLYIKRSFSKQQPNAPEDASYMLLLVDPDAPTPDDPKFAFWRHWVLPGLKPLAGAEGIVAQTKPVLTEYLAPGPKDE